MKKLMVMIILYVLLVSIGCNDSHADNDLCKSQGRYRMIGTIYECNFDKAICYATAKGISCIKRSID